MNEQIEQLEATLCDEKDPKTCIKIKSTIAVLSGSSTAFVANYEHVKQRTVQKWVRKFKKMGTEGLRKSKKAKRRPDVPRRIIKSVAKRLAKENNLTPRILRDVIYKMFKKRYTLCQMRRIMKSLGITCKRSTVKLNSQPSPKKIMEWQAGKKRKVSRLKKKGFVTVIQDETICDITGKDGKKLWTFQGERPVRRTDGKKEYAVVYGATGEDGRRLTHIYDKFNGKTFFKYLQALIRMWGRVHLFMDNAPQHKTKKVLKFLKEHSDEIVVSFLPVATPELSSIEGDWKDCKYEVLVAKSYGTVEELKDALRKYFYRLPVTRDIYAYLWRAM